MSDYISDEQLFAELDKVLAIPLESDDDLEGSDNSDDENSPRLEHTFIDIIDNQELVFVPNVEPQLSSSS